MSETIDKASPELEARARKAGTLTDKAIEAYESRKPKRARKLAEDAIETGALTHIDAARLVELLKVLGATEQSRALAEETLERIEIAAKLGADDAALLFNCGHVCMELGEPERAEPLLRQSHDLDPSEGRAAILLMVILLGRGEPDAVLPIFERFVAVSDTPGVFLLLLAKAMGHHGYRDHAEKVLLSAEPHFADNRLPYEAALAALRGDDTGVSQREAATRLFDDFASNYDQNLKNINNNGPEMIARLLAMIEMEPGAGLRVLDAGCGTGLCAPYLRPFASHVHGCDVSVAMLEKCKEKKVYDLLTRTDLGMAATYPEGPFDLVASGDVFVYFGDLGPVLANIAAVLKPGGWLLFTVEDCTEDAPAQGYRMETSGRYRHDLGYLTRALQKAGFSKPKAQFADTLRTEFRMPIPGRAVAAQRLATFGFATPGG